MKHPVKYLGLMIVIGGLVIAGPSVAKKPEGVGGGNGNSRHEEKHEGRGNGARDDARVNVFFVDRQRAAVHGYYESEFHSGHCPPGLAKKNNGCMPPGQARKWAIGRPLPRDVRYYDLPPRLIVDLGPPPAGHKYVRVASDILLLAVGTGMVVDAISDLGNP